MPDKNRLAYLFRQYLQNTISDRELEELFEYVKKTGRDGTLKEYVTSVYRETQIAGEGGELVDWDTMFSGIVGKSVLTGEDNIAPAKKRILWRSVAAAVVILTVGTLGAYLYFNRDNTPKNIAVVEQKPVDILPGGNKAVLTLANGITMVLDSRQNGKLAGQGNMNVVKMNSGVLVYKKRKEVNGKAKDKIQFNTLSTPRGGAYQITLSDGTKVWLNAASSIHYPIAFNGAERRVEITGEAYFEVAHNAEKPFKVFANGINISVLGTHFNVNAYKDEPTIKTTLVEGLVKVDNLLLKPGEQAVTRDGHSDKLKDVNIRDVIAWKNGFFAFNNANLKEVMRKLSRWYDIDVEYEPGVDNVQRFSGRIDRNLTLSQILNGLKQTRAHFRIEADRKVIILR